MMAVDLPDKLDDVLSNHNAPSSDSHHDDDVDVHDLIAHFTFQDDDDFDFVDIASPNPEMSWDLADSPQSTLWSPEGSSLDSTPPPTPGDAKHPSLETPYDVVGMFDSMNLHAYGNQSFNPSKITPCSNQQLIDQQIRAIQLSRLKQDPKNTASPGSEEAQIPKGQGCGVGSGNGRPPPLFSRNTLPVPLGQHYGSGMRAIFLGGSGSRGGSCGTGVFLPRGSSAPCDSRKKAGCSTVLIPARVVQALQIHFDQMAATSGPKPPLNDVLVSNKDGMYSLQKRESRKEPANIRKDMMLPQEWTY